MVNIIYNSVFSKMRMQLRVIKDSLCCVLGQKQNQNKPSRRRSHPVRIKFCELPSHHSNCFCCKFGRIYRMCRIRQPKWPWEILGCRTDRIMSALRLDVNLVRRPCWILVKTSRECVEWCPLEARASQVGARFFYDFRPLSSHFVTK
jgi:hypothetical protein